MRMTASWSGSKRSYRIQVCGTKIRPTWRAPLGFSTDRHSPPTKHRTELMQKALSSSSSLRVLRCQGAAKHKRRGETQAPLGGKPAKLCYRFGPLTPSARSANLIAGNETKNGFPAPNKEPTTNQKQRLDRKSPIQVRRTSVLRRWLAFGH